MFIWNRSRSLHFFSWILASTRSCFRCFDLLFSPRREVLHCEADSFFSSMWSTFGAELIEAHPYYYYLLSSSSELEVEVFVKSSEF